MDLRLSPEDRRFQDEVRAFVEAELPAEARLAGLEGRAPTKPVWIDWHRRLHRMGWAVPHWPREHGGSDFTALRRFILHQQLFLAPAPLPLPFNTVMLGPMLIKFGTEEQKRRFLPATANLDIWWCQGFSEPNAGSDLSALMTKAERRGDQYVVNGQKTWTTYAHHADWMFCLVRTAPHAKRQEGISLLLIDMKSPGISVRPILMNDGTHEVNDVFFDDVVIPTENLVGSENRGWDCAKFLLGNERFGQARIGMGHEMLRRLRALARTVPWRQGPLSTDPHFRARMALLEIELKTLEITALRMATGGSSSGSAIVDASILKICGSEILQKISEFYLDAAGPFAVRVGPASDTEYQWLDHASSTYLNWRKLSVYGGSNEIQRQIISNDLLGAER